MFLSMNMVRTMRFIPICHTIILVFFSFSIYSKLSYDYINKICLIKGKTTKM